MKKKKLKKLALRRETVKELRGSAAAALRPGDGAIGVGFPTWPTCPDSGCYICSGATCTMGCGSCGDYDVFAAPDR